MKTFTDYTKWTLHHAWVVTFTYILSMIVLILIHGAFGFSMNENGTYLSNTLMHMGSGLILALGTGILQRELLKKYCRVSFFWVASLIIGFLAAELVAGIVLWRLEILRGLINIFNTDVHFPESLIFALAGLIAGMIQFRLLKPYYNKRLYWILASTLGWTFFILSTYLSLYAFILGAAIYGAISGFAFYRMMEPKTLMK